MADKRIVTVDYLNSEGLNKDYIHNNFANALKGSASGYAFLIDDVSPITHEMGVKIRSKNLIPYPYAQTTKTENGVTFTDNGDGSITVNTPNGPAAKSAQFYLYMRYSAPFFAVSGDIVLSGCPSGGSDSTYGLCFDSFDSAGTRTYNYDFGKGGAVKGQIYSKVCYIQIFKGATLNNVVFKPQLELGTTSTAYAPYVPDLTAVKVSRCGKNLIPYPYFDSSKNSVGATITVNEDRSISFSGTPTSYIGFVLYKGNALVKSGTFTISVGNLTNISTTLFIYDGSGATLKTYSFTKSVTVNADDYPTAATWNITMARAASNVEISGTAYPQIELGTTITEYEPYNGTEYTPNADGTVNGVTSLYPNTTLMTDTEGVIIDCEYNRNINSYAKDINKLNSICVKYTDIDQTYSPTSVNAQSGKAVAEAVANIKNITPEQTTFFNISRSNNMLDFSTEKTGMIESNGNIYTGGSYDNYRYFEQFIPVNAGDKISYQFDYNGIRYWGKTHTAYISGYARIVAYDKDKNLLSGLGFTQTSSDNCTEYTVPETVAFIRITLGKSIDLFTNVALLNNAEGIVPYEEYGMSTVALKPDLLPDIGMNELCEYVFKNGIWTAQADNLAENTDLIIAPQIDNKKNCTYDVYAQLGSFTSLTLAHGKTIFQSGYLVIDGTDIKTYHYDGSTAVLKGAYEHGLTFSDYISVHIDIKHGTTGSVTVRTNGGEFTKNNIYFGGCSGEVTVSGAQAMTDVRGSYFLRDIYADTWIFGDSYISVGDSSRYPQHLINAGYTNYLLSGYGGARSNHELISFKNLIENCSPKRICWCLGMNDNDADTAVNTIWKNVFDEIVNICDSKNIELILATIPNVPNRRHDYKNEIVRSSGYRYIDFAKAVNAEAIGSSWYTGMLSTDNVHPTQEGAKALASRFLLDVPEITV